MFINKINFLKTETVFPLDKTIQKNRFSIKLMKKKVIDFAELYNSLSPRSRY